MRRSSDLMLFGFGVLADNGDSVAVKGFLSSARTAAVLSCLTVFVVPVAGD